MVSGGKKLAEKKIAIIGGTGRHGSSLALRLAKSNKKVIIGSRNGEKGKRIAADLRDKIQTCRPAEPLPDQQKNPAGLPLLNPGDLPGVPFYCASTFNLCCSVAVFYVYQRKLHAVNRGRCLP